MNPTNSQRPFLGYGLGLRPQHYQEILDTNPNIDWFEIISENFINIGGKPRYFLEQIAKKYPIVMHGVSLSIGSTDKLDYTYLKSLKKLVEEIKPKWISDHLCFTGADHLNMHDLLPLPYTKQVIKHVVKRIKEVQDFLGRQILIENLSSYLTYTDNEMHEWEFLAKIANDANCNILLDVNNVYVSAYNHHFDPMDYIKEMPSERIHQIHLAGHCNKGDYILDSHDATIIDPVWELYRKTLSTIGKVSTMIERDDNIPSLTELISELDQARRIANE